MANPINGTSNVQQATSVQPAPKVSKIEKPPAKNSSSAPQDTVTISSQAHAAHSIQAK
jgi:hypothetical protein